MKLKVTGTPELKWGCEGQRKEGQGECEDLTFQAWHQGSPGLPYLTRTVLCQVVLKWLKYRHFPDNM